MQQPTRFVHGNETRLINFPRGRSWLRVHWSRAGETVYVFATFLVLDGAEGKKLLRHDADFFKRLAPGRVFQVTFAVVGNALGNAPGRLPVVPSRRMNQQHFQTAGSLAIEE